MAIAVVNETVLAESADTERVEGNQYFPRDSVNLDHVRESQTPYTCPWKGRAQYFDVLVDGEVIEDAAWSYPDPKPAARNIAGHLAFDQSKGIRVQS